MIVSKTEFVDAIKQVNKAFAKLDAEIERQDKLIEELTAAVEALSTPKTRTKTTTKTS